MSLLLFIIAYLVSISTSTYPVRSSIFIIETNSSTLLSPWNMLMAARDNVECLGQFELKPGREFESSIFRGLSASTPSTNVPFVTACLQSVPGIAKVWLSPEYKLQSPLDSARNSTELRADPSAVHRMTGVDQLHKEGVTGKGITIAILDSGVDYLHRALGGGIGPGHKITFGSDLTGDDYVWSNLPVPDNDPYSECFYHGTHVTGIAVGEDPTVGFIGVAPGAEVEYFRITGCDIFLDPSVIISAILKAYERRVDIISASLSLDTGPFTDDPVSALFTRITEEGDIVCVVAAANQGRRGTFSAVAPATGSNVLSVGYANADYLVRSRPRAQFKLSNGSTRDFLWAPATPGRFPEHAKLSSLSLNINASEEACGPIASNSYRNDSSNDILLVRRGGCTFDTKMRNIHNAGWQYMLIYNNERNGLFDFDKDFKGILGAGSLSAEEGESFINLLARGSSVDMLMDSNFTLMPYLSTGPNTLPGGAMNSRSSWGPTGDADIFPSLVAPGGGIFSSFPRSWGGYGVLSGTSMAAPYVAGAVALIKQVRPHLSSMEIIRLLISTARPLTFNDGSNKTYDFLTPVWHQGGGMINVLDAARSVAFPTTSGLSFNDTDHVQRAIQFSVQNTGRVTLNYTVLEKSAISVLPFAGNETSPIPWTTDENSFLASPAFLSSLKSDDIAEVDIFPRYLILHPGQSANVTALLQYPTSLGSLRNCPLYSGYIILQHDNRTELSIPYGGIGCSLKDIRAVPDNGKSVSLAKMTIEESNTRGFEPISAMPPTVFIIPGPELSSLNVTATLFPAISIQLAMFTRGMAIYLVPATHSNPNSTKSLAFGMGETAPPGGFSRIKRYNFLWKGRIADNTWAEAGEYKFSVCALEAWANLEDLGNSSDCATTEPFELTYA